MKITKEDLLSRLDNLYKLNLKRLDRAINQENQLDMNTAEMAEDIIDQEHELIKTMAWISLGTESKNEDLQGKAIKQMARIEKLINQMEYEMSSVITGEDSSDASSNTN